MQKEWTEYKGYCYLVSPVAIFPGQQREWTYEIKGVIAEKETTLCREKAPSAALAEREARKWIGEQCAIRRRITFSRASGGSNSRSAAR